MSEIEVFVLNVGRSGSKATAEHFNLLHEPDGWRPNIERAKERAGKAEGLYGETSHFWKAHLKELTEVFPKAIFIHLVRNGLDVVKSFWHRAHYSAGRKPYHNEILPAFTPDMDRWEKLCWYWRYWNEEIEKYAQARMKLEDINPVRHNQGPPSIKVSDRDLESFKCICGSTMERYGYTCE